MNNFEHSNIANTVVIDNYTVCVLFYILQSKGLMTSSQGDSSQQQELLAIKGLFDTLQIT